MSRVLKRQRYTRAGEVYAIKQAVPGQVYSVHDRDGWYTRGHVADREFGALLAGEDPCEDIGDTVDTDQIFRGYMRHVRFFDGVDCAEMGGEIDYWITLSGDPFPGAWKATCYRMTDLVERKA